MSEVNLVRIMYTVICFLFFMVVLAIAYYGKFKKHYDEEGQRIIDDDDSAE